MIEFQSQKQKTWVSKLWFCYSLFSGVWTLSNLSVGTCLMPIVFNVLNQMYPCTGISEDDVQLCAQKYSNLGVNFSVIQTWAPHLGITTFNAINEKSTIFGWFCSILQGLIHPWCGQSLKVWAKLVKNYTIFINSNKSCDS